MGALAEGPSDRPGRMSEPETILAHALRALGGRGRLAGRRVVVTAGPTRESIDPVRVITNRSSGKMGYRVAEAAWARGADVVLITGPVALTTPVGVEVRRVETTRQLEAAVRDACRAPTSSSWRPHRPIFARAIRATASAPASTERWPIPMEPTEDILSGTRAMRRPGSVIVGFALETGDALAKGRAKLERKALDLIVVNDALEPGAGFEVDTNRVALLGRDGSARILPLQSKRDVADAILDAVELCLG